MHQTIPTDPRHTCFASLMRFESPDLLAQAAARIVVADARAAIESRGTFIFALAGGSTPKLLYHLLATTHRDSIDWHRVLIIFGDERCVPKSHESSNYAMAEQMLFSKVPLPISNIFAVDTLLAPAIAASSYAVTLRRVLARAKAPSIDFLLLGMGADGHTLSLFPGAEDSWLDAPEWCITTKAPPPFAIPDRITLSLAAANPAKRKVFLVAGADKAQSLRQIIASPAGAPILPAARVTHAHWLIDQAAGSMLPS